MSQAFSFDFDNDIDDDVTYGVDGGSGSVVEEKHGLGLLEPDLYRLEDMLSTFPSCLTFTTLSLEAQDGASIHFPRRELYDIRAQLMAEDVQTGMDEMSVPGLSADDIMPNIYEGGFKTWECAVDLAKYLMDKEPRFAHSGGRDMQIVELGAGTALPSLSLLKQRRRRSDSSSSVSPKLHLVLADYNQSVLELATIPNLFLSWNLKPPTADGECEITSAVLTEFLQDLKRHNVTVSAVSGSWGTTMVPLISPPSASARAVNTLVLASETVYSPASIRAFTQVLLDLLANAESTGGDARALVAAKRVYFGVGGGIDEFLTVLEHMGGAGTIVWETKGAGVGRIIMEVVKASQ
ncbi:MAG: hypothetical protein Q9217_001883 [Psora testacea]